MKVVIIGSGNVATVLGMIIKNAGHTITEVVGRNEHEVNQVATLLDSIPVYQLSRITSSADIYVVAVADNAIKIVADELRLPNKIVVHTAAAQPVNLLSNCSDRYGVVYPIQTLKKGLNIIPDVPVLIDGNDDDVIEDLQHFCSNWATSVTVANDEKRLKVHISAVFVNNFTNHLLAVARQFCDNNDIDFSIFYPLIKQTYDAVCGYNPALIQTGPAVRNDISTIEQHRKQLSDNPAMFDLYNQLTNSIIEFYKK